MALELKLPDTEFFSAHRLLRRESVDRAIMLGRWLSIAIIALLVALLLRELFDRSHAPKTLFGPLHESISRLSNSAQPPLRVATAPADVGLIESKNIFGPFTPKTSGAGPAATKPVSQVPLDLIGTFLTEGAKPYAIIEDRNKKQQDVFVVSDSIFGSGKLVGIFSDRVEIERNGQVEVLNLDISGKSSSSEGGGITSTGGDSYEIDEEELDRALANLPLLMTQARAVPYFKDGQSVGLRLFAIKAGSLFEKIGLKNGDILKSINGNNLGDLQQAMRLFEELKTQRSINVMLERNREDKQFQYQIR